MSLVKAAIRAFEDAPAPDVLSRRVIDMLVGEVRRRLSYAPADATTLFARDMDRHPIATHTEDANAQHYELPAAFFETVLGPNLKYSSGLYPPGATKLEHAEAEALRETAAHADLRDGQDVLELGCGWGSLSLWMAQRYPNSRIVSVSNAVSQRAFIEGRATERGLSNLTVVTADMNDFSTDRRFDRVVSVEMFEHMSNWRALLARVRGWLKPDGLLFLHVFTRTARRPTGSRQTIPPTGSPSTSSPAASCPATTWRGSSRTCSPSRPTGAGAASTTPAPPASGWPTWTPTAPSSIRC